MILRWYIYINNISDISQPRLIFITSFHLSGGPGRTWPGALSNRRGRTRDPWGATCGVFFGWPAPFSQICSRCSSQNSWKFSGISHGFLLNTDQRHIICPTAWSGAGYSGLFAMCHSVSCKSRTSELSWTSWTETKGTCQSKNTNQGKW